MIGWVWRWLVARGEFNSAETDSPVLKLAAYAMNFFRRVAKSAMFWLQFHAIPWEPRSAPRGPARTIFTSVRFSTPLRRPTMGGRKGWIGWGAFWPASVFP